MTVCTPWRVARSLDQYRAQLNAAAPHRSLASDGAIGNTAHEAEACSSQHNSCCVRDKSGIWVIRARDFTHDPLHGADMHQWMNQLRLSQDFRIRYIIWDRHSASPKHRSATGEWTWQSYTGASAHTEHGHVSVWDVQSAYDDVRPFAVPVLTVPSTPVPRPVPVPTGHPPGSRVLKLVHPNLRGEDVRYVQDWIGVKHAGTPDGIYGDGTVAGVRWYQDLRGLPVDGEVGPQTWAAMRVRMS